MIHRFGEFQLDAERYELRRRDRPVAAEPKVLETLAYLVEQRGRVIRQGGARRAGLAGSYRERLGVEPGDPADPCIAR